MKPLSAFVSVVALIFAADSPGAPRTPPPHPTLVYAEYQNSKHLVIAADNDKPVIEVEGRRITLPAKTPVSTERAPAYSPQRAELKNLVIAKRLPAHRAKVQIGWVLDVSVDIVAEQELEDCFLVILSFEDEFLMDAAEREKTRDESAEIRERPLSKAQIRLQQVPGKVAANTTVNVPVKFLVRVEERFSNLPSAAAGYFRTYTSYMLFSGGREIRTAQPPQTAEYFHRRELMIHGALLKSWLKQNRGGNQPMQVVQQIAPALETLSGMPKEVVAKLTVGPDGRVSHVEFDKPLPPDADTLVQDTMYAWLFLPKIQNGTAVESRVNVPLQF